MTGLTSIYAAWDNAEQMASDIGELGVTVRQWKNRGFIPPEYWATIIAKAEERGHRLTPDQFPRNKSLSAFAELTARAA